MSKSPSAGTRWNGIWTVFHQVLDGPVEQRTALLDRACGSDDVLRREVEELLRAHDEGLPLLDEPAYLDLPSDAVGEETEEWEITSLEPGTVLADRFEIVRRIGAGGMGEVYEAQDRELERRVALKTVLGRRARSVSALARFRKEIQLSQKVTHHNVCRVFDLVRDGDLVFLTMELLEGETLASRLRRAGPMGLDEAKLILEQITDALEAAHAVGIIHRDLKPGNVMLVDGSTGVRAVVTDFGLATSDTAAPEGAARVTSTGEVLGTPAYMAPEQIEEGAIGPTTDVYALGLLLFEMVTGHSPFEGQGAFSIVSRRLGGEAPSPRDYVPELDARWEAVILHCLKRDPAMRFQHPREVVKALDDTTNPFLASGGLRPWLRWTSKAGVPIAILALVAGFAWWRGWLPTGATTSGAQREAVAKNPLGFARQDTILVADFDNHTGDPSFDDVISGAMARELSNSTFLSVAPRARVNDSLALMRRAKNAKLDSEVARQVAQRDGDIQAVIDGSLTREAEGFLLNVDLIAPASGAVVKSWQEKAGLDTTAIQAAVHRAAIEIRDYLGENPATIAASEEMLQRVTTPSLRALQFYDRADSALASADSAAAEELIREAIRLDPDFASAYIMLARAIRNQGGPQTEYLPYAERAMKLADKVSDRERYFIRASYYLFTGQRRKTIAILQALLRTYPDDFWANWKMAGVLPPAAGAPYTVRCANLRPKNLYMNLSAAMALVLATNEPNGAAPFVRRVITLAPSETSPSPWMMSVITWARLWQAHLYWLEGKPEESKAELDKWAAKLGAMSGDEAYWTNQFLIRGYRNLGLAHRARALTSPTELPITRQYFRGLDAYFSGDSRGVLENFTDNSWRIQPEVDILRAPLRIAALARSGWIEQARAVLASFRRLPPVDHLGQRPAQLDTRLAAELLLATGRDRELVSTLESKGFNQQMTDWEHEYEWFGSSYFLSMQALATAYRKLGRTEDAVAVLRRAVANRARSYPNGTETWMDTQLRLAKLDRELGNEKEAARLEAELRNLMRYADPDFWVVKRLREQAN